MNAFPRRGQLKRNTLGGVPSKPVPKSGSTVIGICIHLSRLLAYPQFNYRTMDHSMQPDHFLTSIAHQQQILPWVHITHPGLTTAELQQWQHGHPTITLPDDLVAFLRQTNGIGIDQQHGSGHLIGAAVYLYPLVDIVPISQAMDGKENDPNFPPSWFAIGQDTDASFSLALDVARSTYWRIDPIVPDEAERSGTTFSECLAWLAPFLPSAAAVYQRAAEAKSMSINSDTEH